MSDYIQYKMIIYNIKLFKKQRKKKTTSQKLLYKNRTG